MESQAKMTMFLSDMSLPNDATNAGSETVRCRAAMPTGYVTGNRNLETEGMVDQVKGAAHHAAGDAKDAGKEAIDAVKNAPSKH
jgi:uncharacterized protein YjbJ (UPF0337 family)